MQSFGTFFGDNKALAAILTLGVAIIVAALLLFLYRLAFGRRLRMAGARSRQPRLGVVDAFDLDRQRQLVLVRRDNVEHLLMIGGPNDLVIESAFVRSQPSALAPAGREKDAPSPPVMPLPPSYGTSEQAGAVVGALPPSPVVTPQPGPDRPIEPSRIPTPTPLDASEPVQPKDLGALADIPAPGPAEMQPPAPPPASPEAAAAPVEPALAGVRPAPLKTLGPLPPRAAGTALPPRPPLTTLRPTTPRPASTLPNRPTPFTPLQRGTSAASLRRDPPSPATPAERAGDDPPPASGTPALPVPVAPQPGRAPDVKPQLPITLDSIESLEEEMAKLLGRASTDKS